MRDEIARRVQGFVADLRETTIWPQVRAVVVSGSAAREEEIWEGDKLISDIDMMVVTDRPSLRLAGAIEAVIDRHSAVGISGGRETLKALRNYGMLSFYEARHNGVVVAGDCSVLRAIPMEGPGDIPKWEAVRVIGNRILEHVKASEGLNSWDVAVSKTYEALAEACLVLERRYRPSYRERLAEIEKKPLTPIVPDLNIFVRATLEARLTDHRPIPRAPGAALEDLLVGFSVALGNYLNAEGTLDQLIKRLGGQECHMLHRLYWSLLMARSRRWSSVRVDPIIDVWGRALRSASGRSPDPRVLHDWRICPQILKPSLALR
jgi:hypothetical protein